MRVIFHECQSEKAGGQGVSGCGVYKTSVPKMALGRGQSSNAKAVPVKRRRLSANMKSGDTVGDIRKKFRGVAYRRRNVRYTVDVRWRGIKLCRECDSWEEGALIYDLAKLETKPSKKPQKLNSDWDFLQAFILNNPFPDSLPLEKLKDAIVNKAVKAVKAWKMFLGDESFRKWSACGYAPEELAQTNEVIVDKNRCLQSENEYSVIKDEFERYKAGVEREKAETERRAAESNAFIDRILQNECKFILFDGNAAADTNDSRIGVTKKGLLAIHSFASLPENNSIDEMGDAEIEWLVLGSTRAMKEYSVMKAEIQKYRAESKALLVPYTPIEFGTAEVFPGNPGADRNDSRIDVTNEGWTPVDSGAPLAENNSIDEMGDAEIEGLDLGSTRAMKEYAVVKAELELCEVKA